MFTRSGRSRLARIVGWRWGNVGWACGDAFFLGLTRLVLVNREDRTVAPRRGKEWKGKARKTGNEKKGTSCRQVVLPLVCCSQAVAPEKGRLAAVRTR